MGKIINFPKQEKDEDIWDAVFDIVTLVKNGELDVHEATCRINDEIDELFCDMYEFYEALKENPLS